MEIKIGDRVKCIKSDGCWNILNDEGTVTEIGEGDMLVKWDKLQISDVKEGKVATYFGRDVTFRNTGFSYIILE